MNADRHRRQPPSSPRRSIGLVSGLGPLAGADVLWKLLQHAATAYGARNDTDYPDVMMVSHGLPGFDATGSIGRTFEHNLIAAVKALEVHRPAVLGVACNTAHLFAADLARHTGATVLRHHRRLHRATHRSRSRPRLARHPDCRVKSGPRRRPGGPMGAATR